MNSIIILCIGVALLCYGGSPSQASNKSNDNINANSNNRENNTRDRDRQLNNRFGNMSEYEVDTYLKENGLYTYYSDCTRQTKVDKIVERNKYFGNY